VRVRSTRAAARALAGGALLVGIAACGGGGPSPAASSSAVPASPSAPVAAGSAVAGASPTASPVSPSASSLSSSGAPLAVDPSLLALLPEAVDGIALEPAPEAAAEIARDASLGRSASAVAVGLAIAPPRAVASGGPGGPGGPRGGRTADPTATGGLPRDDLAIVTVVRLRPGTFSEAFFRDWRDSYDAAACAPAGGIRGHAEATLGDRPTFIATCVEGVVIHHVHLVEQDVLVAVTSLGGRRLGERLVVAIPGASDPLAGPGDSGSAAPTMQS
jgi:hypothetical protein